MILGLIFLLIQNAFAQTGDELIRTGEGGGLIDFTDLDTLGSIAIFVIIIIILAVAVILGRTLSKKKKR